MALGAAAAACVVLAAAGIPAQAATCGSQPCTWNFDQARIPAAQPLGGSGAGVIVAVVDSWIDVGHQDLRGRVVEHVYCASGEGTCRRNTQGRDACDHGTHVAGTVASTRYGVAPKARLLAVQVLRYDPGLGACSGVAEDAAAGIRFAVARGARVINLSLAGLVPGLFQDRAIADAVHDAARSGAVVVFAAGNSGIPLTDDYGAAALLVAGTGPGGRLASYSSRGASVSLAAPGGDSGIAGLNGCRDSSCIRSTFPGNSYGLLEGTSMAAPHVSGAAALLFGQRPGRGRSDVVRTLTSTARPLSGAGHGLLDATAALRSGAAAAPPAARKPPASTGTGTTGQPRTATTSPAVTATPTVTASAIPVAAPTPAPTGSYAPLESLPAEPAHAPANGGRPIGLLVALVASLAVAGLLALAARRGSGAE